MARETKEGEGVDSAEAEATLPLGFGTAVVPKGAQFRTGRAGMGAVASIADAAAEVVDSAVKEGRPSVEEPGASLDGKPSDRASLQELAGVERATSECPQTPFVRTKRRPWRTTLHRGQADRREFEKLRRSQGCKILDFQRWHTPGQERIPRSVAREEKRHVRQCSTRFA